jgi:hypothetical protein
MVNLHSIRELLDTIADLDHMHCVLVLKARVTARGRGQ